MGKGDQQIQILQQQEINAFVNSGSSGWLDVGCSVERCAKQFNFKCVFILILSLSILLFGIFWILPVRRVNGFDADEVSKRSAAVQAFFRLEKPVSDLVPLIGRLEYDINEEIGMPNMKIAVLSMNQSGASNCTDVVFGVLPDPMNVPMNSVILSLLKSSLIALFLQEANLTLTNSIFGIPSTFEILKFPQGISITPGQSVSVWDRTQYLFNFTLNYSISEVVDNSVELKHQLESGLHLRPYENVYVLITNANGSTVAPPVTIQAWVMSDYGVLLPLRLNQLAKTIEDSRSKNLGLDNSVFGKVKSVSLSSYLMGTLHAATPSPTPSPSSLLEPPISQYHAPSNPPIFSPGIPVSTPDPCPFHGFATPPKSAPVSQSSTSFPPKHSHTAAAPSQFSPLSSSKPRSGLAPSPEGSYGSRKRHGKGKTGNLASPLLAPSPLSLAAYNSSGEIWLFGLLGLLSFYLLCL